MKLLLFEFFGVQGGVQILISTKLNLMKLKSNSSSTTSFKNVSNNNQDAEEEGLISIMNETSNSNNAKDKEKKKRLHLAIIDSDEEDSPESSKQMNFTTFYLLFDISLMYLSVLKVETNTIRIRLLLLL